MIHKVLIIDDEELARQRLEYLLGAYPWIQIIGQCSDGIQAIEQINELKPDLIFLDIQMPGKTGFEVLSEITHSPKIIFTTAYNQYAIEAFEFNSIAYLLKPIEPEKLNKSLEKFKEQTHQEIGADRFELMQRMSQFLDKQEDKFLKRIQIKIGDRVLLLSLDEVLYFESEDKYTAVITEHKRHIVDTPLIELEQKLKPEKFIRIHRACLVHVDWIAEIQRSTGGKMQIQLKDPSRTILTVSRSFVDRVRSL